MTPFAVIGIVLLLLTVALFFLKRRSRSSQKREQQTESISYSELDSKEGQHYHSIKNRIKSLFKRPDHPVRKMVLQFERFAAKHKKGRKPFETIEDWFKRIGMNSNMMFIKR